MKQNILGIDAGGTNVKMFCQVDGKNYTNSIPSGPDFTREKFLDGVREFIQTLPCSIEALAIVHPGVASKTGIVATRDNYLKGLNASAFDFLNVPVSFLNDANAAALAAAVEYPESKILVAITNGTGIGSGIVINGILLEGVNGCAGEITNNPVGNSKAPVQVGRIATGRYLMSALKGKSAEEAETIIKEAARYFGMLLIQVINVLNPDTICLSGGTFGYPGFFETVRETVNELGEKRMVENLNLVLSKSGVYSGCIGAIEYAVKKQFTNAGSN